MALAYLHVRRAENKGFLADTCERLDAVLIIIRSGILPAQMGGYPD